MCVATVGEVKRRLDGFGARDIAVAELRDGWEVAGDVGNSSGFGILERLRARNEGVDLGRVSGGGVVRESVVAGWDGGAGPERGDVRALLRCAGYVVR